MLRWSRRAWVVGLGTVIAAMMVGAVVATTVAAAAPSATVGISKTVVGLTGAATPGDSFSYQLTAQCSSLTVACVGATGTDVLPAGLEVIAIVTLSGTRARG